MFDFIGTAAEYLHDDIVLTTLAELEDAEPCPYLWASPEARVVARELLGKDPNRSPSMRARFARALRDRPHESIEDLLERTASPGGDMSSVSSDTLLRCAIGRLFDLIGWEVDWSPLLTFLRQQFILPDATHTFICFNYDLILDRAIQISLNHNVDFTSVYGFDISLQVNDDLAKNTDRGPGSIPALPLSPLNGATSNVLLLKPHGSLNWLVPPPVDSSASTALGRGETVVLPLNRDGCLRYFSSADTFQRVQPHGQLPVEVEPLIVTPMGAKRSDRAFLRTIRQKQEDAIRSASEAYILGWSLPPGDRDQEYLIRSNIARRAMAFDGVTTVNLSAGVDYHARVADVFGVEKKALRIFNSGFRDFARLASAAPVAGAGLVGAGLGR